MHGALSIHFTAVVWRYESKGGWYFVSLPEEDSARIREIFKSQEQGWGRLQVEATFVRSSKREVRGGKEKILTGRISEVKREIDLELNNASNLTSHISPLASHKTAIWFDTKRNTYLLPIKADIRRTEGIDEGDEVGVELRI